MQNIMYHISDMTISAIERFRARFLGPKDHRRSGGIILPAFLALSLTAAASAITVDANLTPDSIQVGQVAILRVQISDDNRATVEMPKIDGLSFSPAGSSTEVRIINGALSTNKTLRYEVIPDREGTFDISPILVHSNGGLGRVKAKLVLKVAKGRALPRGGGRQAQPGVGAPARPATPPGASTVGKDIAFLHVPELKEKAVVGETIPVEIRAYFQSGARVSLRSLPSVVGGAFTLHIKDRKPRQRRASVGGKLYTVLVFEGTISPVKAGEFDLGFDLGVTMVVRDRSKKRRRRPLINDPFFNDPFFDDVFAPMVEKDVKLVSDPLKIKVEAPPVAGRPEGFDGAVGRFSIAADASASTVRAGDPLTLTVRVMGEGSFGRVSMPRMTDPSGWKTYPAKQHMVEDNSIGTKGTKIFEQTIVPRNESVTGIPALEFVYYDPETGKYRTARSAPIPVKVTPGTDISDDAQTPAGSGAKSGDKRPSSAAAPSEHVPHHRLGWLRGERLDRAPWFFGAIAGVVAVFLALALETAWRRKRNNPQRLAAESRDREIQSSMRDMDKAAAGGDAQAFFAAARRALQKKWGGILGIAPEAVTAVDLPDPESRAVFEAADSVAFSGKSYSASDLADWKTRTLDALKTADKQ